MLTVNEIETLSKSLYTILRVEDCFKKSDFHERYANQLFRIGVQFNNIQRKKEITNNYLEEYLKWNTEKASDLPMTKYDCLVELTTLLCSFGLTHYEFLKRFFIETMILDRLGSRTGIKFSTRVTYGTFVKAFEKLPNFDKRMNEMLDEDFRNALAHDTWYLDENGMKYANFKKEIIAIPFSKIPQKINMIGITYTIITKNYFQDFFPEMVKIYEKVGSKEINKLFPLYGMNED